MEYVIFLDDEIELISACVNLIKKDMPDSLTAKVFNDSVECFEFIEQKNDKINYVFIDYSMPEIDGITFLNKLKTIYPNIKGYILTGWSARLDEIKKHEFVTDVIEKNADFEQNILKVIINK